MTTSEKPQARLILVVEDNRDVRLGICEALPAAFPGTECIGAPTARDARRLLAEHRMDERPFDLALVDIGLPDGSGVDIIRLIADEMPDTMPVVITIFDNDQTLFDALAAGAKGYILKSATMTGLVEQLKRIDAGEPPLSPQMAHRMMAHFRTLARPPTRSGTDSEAGETLTAREQEVLTFLAKGLTAQDIATALSITRNTCATHIKAIYRKLRISSRAEAALEAGRRGLL